MTRTATFHYTGDGYYSAELRDQDGTLLAFCAGQTLKGIVRWARENGVTAATGTANRTEEA